MDQFEIVTITLSFVLGLSMGNLLWSSAAVVRKTTYEPSTNALDAALASGEIDLCRASRVGRGRSFWTR